MRKKRFLKLFSSYLPGINLRELAPIFNFLSVAAVSKGPSLYRS
jgi:hypothetical protein